MGWDVGGAQVLVTGGTSGIGRAAATELARRGAAVMITARDQQKGRETAAANRADTGVDVEVGLLDLSSLDVKLDPDWDSFWAAGEVTESVGQGARVP